MNVICFSEFLNKVQCELDNMSGVSNGPHSVQSMQPLGGATGSTYTRDVVDNLFQGELVSEVSTKSVVFTCMLLCLTNIKFVLLN